MDIEKLDGVNNVNSSQNSFLIFWKIFDFSRIRRMKREKEGKLGQGKLLLIHRRIKTEMGK